MQANVDNFTVSREAQDHAFLLSRLRQRVAEHPDRAALVAGDQRLSYAELWARIDRIGQALAQRIQPGDRVALVMDNGTDCVSAPYGIWWAGGVVVALNNALKLHDLAALVAQCGAALVLTDHSVAGLPEALAANAANAARATEAAGTAETAEATTATPALAMTVAELTAEAMASAAITAADAVSPRQRRPGDTAALIFTSGTTGQPKGVMLSHANLAANVAAVQHTLPMRPDDITLCVLPFHYAYGGSVLHTHLTLGATLVLENSLMYPQRIVTRMAECEVTAFYGVPSSFYLLMARGHLSATPLPRLRYLAQAGAAMAPARIEELRQLLPQAPLWLMYGQTEACSRLTTLSPTDHADRPGSAGRALPGVTLAILDANGGPLPAGERGEVCARGPNVMQGYWASPTDTAAVLQDGWLRTGDIGHLDGDGFLYLHGRSRDILKIGAHRVAPQEIEHAVQGVAGVQECAVLAMPDALLGEVPRACVIPAPGHAPSDALKRDILRACREQLALYKCPKQVDFFDAFPRTASGKVQKHLIAEGTRQASHHIPKLSPPEAP